MVHNFSSRGFWFSLPRLAMKRQRAKPFRLDLENLHSHAAWLSRILSCGCRRMESCRANKAGKLLRISLALGIIVSGLVAVVLGAAGHFLPHDEAFLGMTANDLCSLHGCRIVHFMIHDRISFGGALLAIGLLYSWLAVQREAWAWWALLLSNAAGFFSFFAYLGYGYLDTWHGLGTLALVPLFMVGLGVSRPMQGSYRSLFRLFAPFSWVIGAAGR